MAIQSNALNFLSYTQGNVDPRTGQYGFSMEIPPLNPNDLQGPDLPMQLNFNPLNDSNSGFGIGWALNLSSYHLDSGMLELHTGERFAIFDNGPGEPVVVPERKLESFQVTNIGGVQGTRLRVAHKAGLIEILEPLKVDPRRCLPSRVVTPSGHGITLEYDTDKGRLVAIRDDSQRVLLTLTYNGDHEALLDIQPGSEAHLRFTLQFAGVQLRTLVMPTSDQARWEFHYRALGPVHVLERLINPLEGEEFITHREHGHQLPGVNRFVPHVIEHVAKPNPLDETTFITTRYAYSNTNFLGYGASGVVWDDAYNQDQLYKFTGHEYVYDSTASHYLDGQVLRTIKRSFNRFHLMTEQVTEESGCVETVTTEYHDKPGSFAEQDEYCQLPATIRKTWTDKANPQARRDEILTTAYDRAGNLVEERLANGMHIVRSYYPVAESDGCPQDPEGFRRNLHSITTYPANDSASAKPAPILRTLYTYKAMPILSQASPAQQAESWLVVDSEELVEVLVGDDDKETEQLLRRIDMGYLNMPGNLFLHGRSNLRTTRMGTYTSTTQWHYEKVADDQGQLTHLRTRTTLTPPGGTLEKTSASVQSVPRNMAIEDEDINGVVTRHRYDELNRLIEQTVAPGDPHYCVSRTFEYGNVSEDNRSLWYAQVTDVNGVVTRTYHDGLNRPVRETRTLDGLGDAAAAGKITRKVSETAYDSIGRVTSETLFDYLPAAPGSGTHEERPLALTSRYAYDGWGQTCEVLRADGVREKTEFSPFGENGNKVTEWIVSPDKPDIRQQLTVEEHNLFNKPTYHYQLLQQGMVESDRTDYAYDGLGRCVKETFSFTPQQALEARVTEYSYDHWGRMQQTLRADGSLLLRTFAGHSSNELTTLLEVCDKTGEPPRPICRRTFDGLERMTSQAIGPRLEAYSYQGLTQLLESRTCSNTDAARNDKSRHVTRYRYEPALTTQPVHLSATVEDAQNTLAPDEAAFNYLPTSAAITSADNGNGGRVYSYTDQGFLAGEEWQGNGQQDYKIDNLYSLEGRLIHRKHTDGVACQYDYDLLGRVQSITQGDLQCTFEYNSEGRLETTTTRDNRDATRYVRSVQTYDDLGREHRRTLDANGEQWVLVLSWRDSTTLQSRTLYRAGDEDEQAFIRKEVFGYDDLERLVIHDFEGDWTNEAPDSERRKALPRNAAGRRIIAQTFVFDALDNLERCLTEFDDGKRDTARFSYAEDGSFQLTKVTHTLQEDYPAEQGFSYDARGNMLNDEQGRTLEYDSQGRLQRVLEADAHELVRYLYDGHNQLLASVHNGQREVQRRYLGNALDSTWENTQLTQYLYGDGRAVGEQQAGKPDRHQLLMTDNAGSVVAEVDSDGARYASYSAYGERPADNGLRTLLAFNGELREEDLGWYLLGSGYRAFNPALMRFHSPDSLAQEVAGPNPYVYALGNPVKWRDPTGHYSQFMSGTDAPPRYNPVSSGVSWFTWLGLAVSAVFLAISAVAMPWTAPAALAMGTTYAKAVIGIVGQGISLALQAGAVAARDNESLSMGLNVGAFFVGIASGVLGGSAVFKLRGVVNQTQAGASSAQKASSVASGSRRSSINSVNSGGVLGGNNTDALLQLGEFKLPRVKSPLPAISNGGRVEVPTSGTPTVQVPISKSVPANSNPQVRPSTGKSAFSEAIAARARDLASRQIEQAVEYVEPVAPGKPNPLRTMYDGRGILLSAEVHNMHKIT
ncbi:MULTISPECIES: RHS repeat domain-containing protein [unclassified Pseudomonas]|uniref:RHS repeat domain-containing protein n=1 Tax=unclassified Pseudomonas TaxID=196821 RepID=UPI00257A2285|nr:MULTISPECIES: RHS repeat-associated core domain-containing protein [unclassified Pseudomonas]